MNIMDNLFLLYNNPNLNYKIIAKEFLEKYCGSVVIGLFNIGHYYDNNSLITLHIVHNNIRYVYEFIGYNNFKCKLFDMKCDCIRFYNITPTFQPTGKNDMLIIFYGKAEINNIHYNVITSFIINISTVLPKIINQTIEFLAL